MDSSRDLQLLLLALRGRVLDPNRLAEAAAEWRGGTGLMTFLAGRGVIAPDDLRQLECATVDWPAAVRDGDPSLQPTPRHPGDGQATTDWHAGDTPAAAADGAADAAPAAGRYEVVRLHQTGGLGQVWLARDTAVGREVALKTLRKDRAAGEVARRRFVREARVTGQLEHPSIVPLYDIADDDSDPFYVMRFVTGRTLFEAATEYHRRRGEGRAGPLDLNTLLDAFVDVCRGVAFAHSRDILHRDLKGQNIIVGEFGEVFLLDWGLAKSVGEEDSPPDGSGDEADDGMTAPGVAVGTPAYMAPEVAAGGAATKASDVYGLGAILYSLLTGRAPYSGKLPEVLKLVTTTDPPPVVAANPSAPAALAAVCRRAMARNPADRYASAEELATEVRRWLADEPVEAYREPWPARAVRWARRRKTAVVAAAVLLLTGAVASTAAAGLLYREEQKTEAERDRATKHAAGAIEVARDLTSYVEAQEMGLGVGSGESIEQQRRERLDSAIASYQRLLELQPGEPAVRRSVARLHRMRANLHRFLDIHEEAEKSYRESTRLFEELAAEFPENREFHLSAALVRRDHGLLLQRLGRDREAAPIGEETVRTFEALYREEPAVVNHARLLAYSLVARSDRHFHVGQLAESERDARRAAELYAGIANKAGLHAEPLDPLFHAMAEHNLAIALREQGRTQDALAQHDRALNRMTALLAANKSRDVLSFLHHVRAERAWTQGTVKGQTTGMIYSAFADLDTAIRGWDLLTSLLGENPTDLYRHAVAGLYSGRLRMLVPKQPGAARHLTAAAKSLEKLVKASPQTPRYHYDLGRVHAAQAEVEPENATDRRRQARAALETAVRLYPANAEYRKALADLDAAGGTKPRP